MWPFMRIARSGVLGRNGGSRQSEGGRASGSRKHRCLHRMAHCIPKHRADLIRRGGFDGDKTIGLVDLTAFIEALLLATP